MSLLDEVLIFGKDAVASSATEFNVLDLGTTSNNVSGNRHGAGYLNIHVNTVMDATATTISLYEGDDAANVNTIVDGTTLTLTGLAAGSQLTVRLPKPLKQFVTVKADAVNTGTIDAFIGAPLADH